LAIPQPLKTGGKAALRVPQNDMNDC